MTKAFMLETRVALGNPKTREDWKAAFRMQRLVVGVAEGDLVFADRVLDACLHEPAFIRALIAEAAAKADSEMDIACHNSGPGVLHELAVEA
mmetsp:Transcript_87654/g.157967  ORF Transcript_87654/g.157967 Transcript_87654/m.157967 type:complete len:92 (+) Transcript_87654:86-361(+)